MIVVSDASPVSSLIRIDELRLLQQLFTIVVIPPKVEQELLLLERFGYDLHELKNSEWILVKSPTNIEMVRSLTDVLDAGEAEAIALANELKVDYLLIDEKRGREVATEHGLRVIGILGVLVKAKKCGLISKVKPFIQRLRVDAKVWIANDLEQVVLKLVDEV